MKNAFFLTGAAARISQEVAFIDKLNEHWGVKPSSNNSMLAGFSSGALNIAAINACFRNDNPLSWEHFFKKDILFKLKTSDVYVRDKFIPLNTQPLRSLIEKFLYDAGLNVMNDFSFDSFVLTFSYLQLKTLWASNLTKQHQTINLSDLMMATSAIPIIFPDQTLKTEDEFDRKFAFGRFADGGTGGTFKRFEQYLSRYVKNRGAFDNLFIISPMREVTHEDYEQLYSMIPSIELFKMELKDVKLLRLFLQMISQNGFETFIKRFYKWTLTNKISNNIYVCIPELDKNFPLLDFSRQEEQYHSVCNWIDANIDKLAIPIKNYHDKLK